MAKATATETGAPTNAPPDTAFRTIMAETFCLKSGGIEYTLNPAAYLNAVASTDSGLIEEAVESFHAIMAVRLQRASADAKTDGERKAARAKWVKAFNEGTFRAGEGGGPRKSAAEVAAFSIVRAWAMAAGATTDGWNEAAKASRGSLPDVVAFYATLKDGMPPAPDRVAALAAEAIRRAAAPTDLP